MWPVISLVSSVRPAVWRCLLGQQQARDGGPPVQHHDQLGPGLRHLVPAAHEETGETRPSVGEISPNNNYLSIVLNCIVYLPAPHYGSHFMDSATPVDKHLYTVDKNNNCLLHKKIGMFCCTELTDSSWKYLDKFWHWTGLNSEPSLAASKSSGSESAVCQLHGHCMCSGF